MIRKFISGFLKCLLFGAFLVAIGGLSASITVRYISTTGHVAVPDLVGKDLVYATDLLAERHLKLKTVAYQFDPNVTKDAILAQDPPSGAQAKKNQTIRITLSKGAESATIPEVLGRRWQDATIQIRQKKFRVGNVAYVHSVEAPVDHIIAQTPFPNSEASMGASVHLLVSLGPYQTVMVMPDLVGEQMEYALQVLGQLNLVLGKIERDAEYPIEPDTVISQIPKPGTLIQEQNIVNLVVSGPGLTKDSFQEDVLPVQFETLEYTVPLGPFDREVVIMLKNAEGISEVFRQFVPPGRNVSIAIPVAGATVAEIYVDGVLAEVRRW